MMMEDRITLDQISTQSIYDLSQLCENDPSEYEVNDSPYELINNRCKYYQPLEVKDLLEHEHNSMSVFCLNCQGLKAHWDAFQNLLHETSGCSGSFDILGITELYSMSEGDCSLNGYHPIEFKTRKDTSDSRGGVAMYIRDTYKYKLRQDLSIFIPNVFESIFIELRLSSKTIIIGTIYRPNTPPKADIDIFMHTMQQLQNILNTENKEVIIMGDINIDLLKFSTHTKTNEYLENTFSQGYVPIITKPTRITSYSATLIDHIYINKQANAISGILITDITDHLGIFSILKFNSKSKQISSDSTTFRSHNQFNMTNFNNLLQGTDFTPVLEIICPNLAYDTFLNIYMEAYNAAFPIKTSIIPKKYIKKSPWITKGLVQSSITKSKLHLIKLKQPTDTNINRYKTFCQLYNRLLRITKANYYNEQLEAAKFNMKETWSILRSAMNKVNNKCALPEYFNEGNKILTDKKEIVEQFNTFFANIGKDISNNVPTSQNHFTHFLNHGQNINMFLDPISPADILNTTAKLKTKTSKGHDHISTKIVKHSIDHITLPLTHIINQSLTTGIVPQQMKTARVIPIFKSGNKNTFSNYRPISILPAFSKILEKVMATKLIKYLEFNKLLYQHQYGFRPKYSTIHPIIHLLNQIAEENDKVTKNLTLSVFIDLSKAFDTIRHDILLHKLDNLGIRGVANAWFKSYLTDRNQYMDLYNIKSSLADITCGVPQGSILGPILFLIYMNDISNSTNLHILSFADDTTVTMSSPDVFGLYAIMNMELEKLNDWFRANRLCLNVKKTKYILFRPTTNYPKTINENIYLNGQQVDRVGNNQNEKSFKFLGIHLDETLTWKYHTQNVCSKIARSNYIINKVKNVIPKSSLKTLYSSLIQSHINYGILVWGCSHFTEKVNKKQKQIHTNNKQQRV